MGRARDIRLLPDCAVVTLTRGYEAVIDLADVPLVAGRNWSALVSKNRKAVYAVRVVTRNGKQTMLLLHRIISDAPAEMHVDHRDGDGLNNRRDNLRVCTQAENNRNQGIRSDNTCGFKGVSLDKRINRWKAEIETNGRRRFLGHHATPEAAHAAYLAAAAVEHGEFARGV